MNKEPRKIDPALVAAGIAVVAAIIGGALLFWIESKTDTVSIKSGREAQEPWLNRWMEARTRRSDDTIRRLEQIESKMMNGGK